MMELSKTDLHFVLARCPRDIITVLKEQAGKLFLAGGFIRATIAGEKVSDVDLFGGDKDFLKTQAKDLAYNRKGKHFESKNAVTVLAPPRIPVQFITRWLYSDPVALVESFDFTVCQAVIWAEKYKAGEKMDDERTPIYKYRFVSLCSDRFYPDLAARRLVYTYPVRQEEAGGSFMRVIKFVRKGYNVQAPSLAGVIARIANAIDTDKWKELPGTREWEQRFAFVATGLLREVDPLTVIDGVDFVDEHEVINEE